MTARRITLSRRYSLGDFKYLNIDDVVEVPETHALDPKVVDAITFLQLINFEIIYRKYERLVKQYPHNIYNDTVIEALEKLREDSILLLHSTLNGHSTIDLEENKNV